jgi:hypothetical protein
MGQCPAPHGLVVTSAAARDIRRTVPAMAATLVGFLFFGLSMPPATAPFRTVSRDGRAVGAGPLLGDHADSCFPDLVSLWLTAASRAGGACGPFGAAERALRPWRWRAEWGSLSVMRHRIVVLGGGTGGTLTANHLRTLTIVSYGRQINDSRTSFLLSTAVTTKCPRGASGASGLSSRSRHHHPGRQQRHQQPASRRGDGTVSRLTGDSRHRAVYWPTRRPVGGPTHRWPAKEVHIKGLEG